MRREQVRAEKMRGIQQAIASQKAARDEQKAVQEALQAADKKRAEDLKNEEPEERVKLLKDQERRRQKVEQNLKHYQKIVTEKAQQAERRNNELLNRYVKEREAREEE